jgi:pimeloyl-ACP methyl ester carboxylesterase
MRTFRAVAAAVMAAATFGLSPAIRADGPADNQVATVRQIPPPGVPIEQADRDALTEQLKTLKQKVDELRGSKNPTVQKYLPDVEIFSRAIDLALNEDGFFDPKDGQRAQAVAKEGIARAEALAQGQTPWTKQTGSVVRGFRSKLDGTPQPYGIVYQGDLTAAQGIRADIWCRGRSEKGLEVQFLATRMTSQDPVPASGVLMIHPFGRYCNANKLAGEVDTLEALEHALSEYPIDPQRVAIRGFSMGGAAAWHLAVHYPDKWFAANPGAGFSETPDFLKVFQKEELKPYPFEQTLWQMYDCPVWIRNLRMLPTIAYSGEIDSQKQAADIMAAACWNLPEGERFELTHIIAPKTAHSIAPAARAEIEKRLAIVDGMREDPEWKTFAVPREPEVFTFTTTTLKYNSAHCLTVHGLHEHWRPATVRFSSDGTIKVETENVTEFSLELAADSALGLIARHQRLGVAVFGSDSRFNFDIPQRSDRSWGARFRFADDKWQLVSPIEPPSKDLVKKHNLQGPIDDAFMSPFLFVKPTAAGRHPEVDKWVESEFNRAVREWHRQMRGEARVKTSEELQPADIENYHLILWGDAQSNPTIAKVAGSLPIQWGAEQIIVGEQKFDAKTHAPVLIYPNPLNPEKYVVLNSSFTYREYDYLNNARQVPKLPDWAIIDLTTPPDARWPGKIAAGDFFGEKWELKTAK